MSKRFRLALVAGLALGVVALPQAGLAGVDRISVGQQSVRQLDQQDVDTARQELVVVQRTVREALVQATLTTDQLSQAYGLLDAFARNYARLQSSNDPVLAEMSYEELFQGKVGNVLASEFGLHQAEVTFLSDRVQDWASSELRAIELRAGFEGGQR